MEEELICNKCNWSGSSDELVSKTNDLDDPCILCPVCGSHNLEVLE